MDYIIEGRCKTWSVIDEATVDNIKYCLFENCYYGDEAGYILASVPKILKTKTTKSGIELKIIPEECEVGEFWDGDITVCLDDAGIESAEERRLRLNVTKARLAVEFANKKLEKAVAELTTYRKNR